MAKLENAPVPDLDRLLPLWTIVVQPDEIIITFFLELRAYKPEGYRVAWRKNNFQLNCL